MEVAEDLSDDRLADILLNAERPCVLLGSQVWTSRGSEAAIDFVVRRACEAAVDDIGDVDRDGVPDVEDVCPDVPRDRQGRGERQSRGDTEREEAEKRSLHDISSPRDYGDFLCTAERPPGF